MSEDSPHARYRKGFDDGYRVGPDGIEPDGTRADHGYDPALTGDPDYHRGLSEGRTRRIDDDWPTNHPPTPTRPWDQTNT